MKLLSFLLKHSRGTVIVATLISILGGVGGALLVAMINTRVTQASPTASHAVWYFAGLVTLMLAANLIAEFLLNKVSEEAYYDMRIHLCKQILGTPLRNLEEIGMHRLLAALTGDIPTLIGALLKVPIFTINLAVLIGYVVYVGWLSPTLLIPLIISLTLSVISVEVLERKARRALRLARAEADSLLKHFHALTEGNKELKLHRRRREAFISENLEPTARSLRQHSTFGRNLNSLSNSWTQTLHFIVIGLLLFVLTSAKNMSPQALTGYTLAILFMRIPIVSLLDIIPLYSRAGISLRKVEELGLSLAAFNVKGSSTSKPARMKPWSRLELDGVMHMYYQEREDRNFVFGPATLSFTPGELVLVIGGNGSGKTTFVKLLTGLYAPESGRILKDGEPVTDENRDDYRQYFSAVFSEFYLFDKLLGLDDFNLDSKAREYIMKLDLAHKVKVQDGRLSTTDLSRGQRKRLALLTSYLEDRPIYVFDEWAADQDPAFKEVFYLELLPELKARGKTVIVISHDDHYYSVADRIIKLDNGQVEYDQTDHKYVLVSTLRI